MLEEFSAFAILSHKKGWIRDRCEKSANDGERRFDGRDIAVRNCVVISHTKLSIYLGISAGYLVLPLNIAKQWGMRTDVSA